MCRSLVRCMDRVFDDKRLAVGVLMVWLALVMLLFDDIGLLQTTFMNFGPSSTAKFMGAVLDTWYKWGMVAVFTLINTSVNDFMSDAISPWLLNTITDHKSKFIPYPKYVCLAISQLWSIYCNLMSVFGMFLAMTQIDFVLIRILADLLVNTYTNLKFMRFKEYSPSKYNDIEMQNVPIMQHHQQQHDSALAQQHTLQQQQQQQQSTYESSSNTTNRQTDAGGQTIPLFVIEEDDLSPRQRKH